MEETQLTENTLTLKRVGVNKWGISSYRVEGAPKGGTIRFSRFAFAGEPPDAVTITASGLQSHNPNTRVGVSRTLTPEQQAAKEAKKQERDATRAQKAVAKAEKAAQREEAKKAREEAKRLREQAKQLTRGVAKGRETADPAQEPPLPVEQPEPVRF